MTKESTEVQAKELLTREEAAQYMGIKPNTLAVWACNKRYGLPMVKLGRTVRYRRKDVEAFVERHIA